MPREDDRRAGAPQPARPAPWHESIIHAVANVLGDTEWPGLSNREIDRYLAAAAIASKGDGSKRVRLADSLLQQTRRDGTDAAVRRFLTEAMAIGHYVTDQRRFHTLRQRLNEPLAIAGATITEQGNLTTLDTAATTLDEVAKLAGALRSELDRRGVHHQVIRFCDEELLRQSLFHAVFEAVKGVAERLRQLSGLTLDGGKLVDACFGGSSPLVRVNALRNETDFSEHRGFQSLLKGIFGTFRNPPAHTPRVTGDWQLSQTDALDLFCTLSFIHRRFDKAIIGSARP
jgi:uncharacterized protein (TIGR02391 family)